MSLAAEIRRTISVPAVLEHLGLEPPERIPGLIHCPVHDDDTPSLNIDETVWYCHGCGVGGGAIELVQFVGGVNYSQALLFLEGATDLLHEAPALERKPKELPDLTRQYESARTSKPSSWEAGNLEKWAAEKWPQGVPPFLELEWAKLAQLQLWIPHRDADGVVRGIKLREMNHPPLGRKTSVKGSNFLSRLYRVLERPWAPMAFLVEGETDTWTMSAHYLDDLDIAVYGMPSGVGAWKPWFADELNRHRAVIVAFDSDEPADKGFKKVKETLRHAVRLVLPEGVKDVTEAFAAGWRPPV